jgi:hypothetical protein
MGKQFGDYIAMKIKMIWIDDDPERIHACNNFKDENAVECEFKSIYKEDIIEVVTKIMSKYKIIDGIIIDHRLNMGKNELFQSGSSIVELFKNKWPNCPIICVTAVDIESDIDSFKSNKYDCIIPNSSIEKYYDKIIALIESFNKLSKTRITIQNVLKLMKVPDDDCEVVEKTIPNKIKDRISHDKTIISSISRWINESFLLYPGFIYDNVWTATTFGIKIESLYKIENYIENAKYDGLFSYSSKDLWWKSKLKEYLYSLEGNTKYEKLLNISKKIKKNDLVKCYACNELDPEIVAYVDAESDNKYPMHYRCTLPHPKYEKILFYDEIRMMKGRD